MWGEEHRKPLALWAGLQPGSQGAAHLPEARGFLLPLAGGVPGSSNSSRMPTSADLCRAPGATGPSPAPRPWVRHPLPSSSSNMEGQLRPQWTGWLRSESKTHRNFVVTPESVQSPLPCLASGLRLSLLGVWVGPLGDRQGQAPVRTSTRPWCRVWGQGHAEGRGAGRAGPRCT